MKVAARNILNGNSDKYKKPRKPENKQTGSKTPEKVTGKVRGYKLPKGNSALQRKKEKPSWPGPLYNLLGPLNQYLCQFIYFLKPIFDHN